MEKSKIIEAKKEAQRFINKVDEFEKRYKNQPFALYGSKESGAVRRSSMDLTRALANMRKSQRD